MPDITDNKYEFDLTQGYREFTNNARVFEAVEGAVGQLTLAYVTDDRQLASRQLVSIGGGLFEAHESTEGAFALFQDGTGVVAGSDMNHVLEEADVLGLEPESLVIDAPTLRRWRTDNHIMDLKNHRIRNRGYRQQLTLVKGKEAIQSELLRLTHYHTAISVLSANALWSQMPHTDNDGSDIPEWVEARTAAQESALETLTPHVNAMAPQLHTLKMLGMEAPAVIDELLYKLGYAPLPPAIKPEDS